jgi:diadenylate cyclase
LHDGAVIIDNESIIAARCMLPLTSTVKFSGTSLGKRHRAGLGLSEQADAIVIIVSEETGFISIAEGGELTINIPKNDLLQILLSRLSKK